MDEKRQRREAVVHMNRDELQRKPGEIEDRAFGPDDCLYCGEHPPFATRCRGQAGKKADDVEVHDEADE